MGSDAHGAATGRRAVVTGGAGFIGSHVVDALVRAGWAVDVVDNLSTGSAENLDNARSLGGDAVVLHELDVVSGDLVGLFERRRPALVCHLAAQIDVASSVADPRTDATINVLGTIAVLEAARAGGAARVVYAASGGALYGDADPAALPLDESAPHRPLSPYGVSKMAGWDYVVAYHDLYGIAVRGLALANVYGPRQGLRGEAGVVARFVDMALRDEPATIFGDGGQTRDFVYVGDVAVAFAAAAERGGDRLYNIGTGTETTVRELHAVIAAAAGCGVAPKHLPERTGDLYRSSLDSTLARAELGWAPQMTLAAGVAAVVDARRQRLG